MMHLRLAAPLACAFAFLALTSAASADLRPDEIAIIAVRGSRESERLAEYYAEQRGIPTENICLVVMPRGETISHEKWRWAVRPEIRKWLEEHDPQRNLRCLVTMWDVPLRIGRDKEDSPSAHRYAKYLEGERAKKLKVIRDIAAEYGLLAPGVALTGGDGLGGDGSVRDGSVGDGASDRGSGIVDADDNDDDNDDEMPDGSISRNERSEIEQLQQRVEKQLQQAQARIRQLSDSDARQPASAKLQQYTAAIGGVQVLFQSLQQRLAQLETTDDKENQSAVRADVERMRGMLLAYTQMQQSLERAAPTIERDAALLDVVMQSRGLITCLEWIDAQLKVVARNETHASFDSELSLVLWPDDYPLLRWQPNYLRGEYDNSQLRDAFPTLMVARIDAPTLALAKGLIDTAIQIEKQGLEGKVYIDARGIGKLDQKNVKPGSFADYDRALLITAKGLQDSTSLDVTLDDESALFQPGDCPDAALYCGWYSLGKYVDAFDWAPGAVGYHLASGEATTLRSADSQVWCKRMLEDGVCATIGPTYEPYLIAFPRPNEFFSLLLSGNLSLVECFYRTKPFNSWTMTLVGDPLYRPFANRNVRK